MTRRDPRYVVMVLATTALIVGVLGSLAVGVGRPYPGFFFSADYRIFPVTSAARDAGLRVGDRIIAVDGARTREQVGAPTELALVRRPLIRARYPSRFGRGPTRLRLDRRRARPDRTS